MSRTNTFYNAPHLLLLLVCATLSWTGALAQGFSSVSSATPGTPAVVDSTTTVVTGTSATAIPAPTTVANPVTAPIPTPIPVTTPVTVSTPVTASAGGAWETTSATSDAATTVAAATTAAVSTTGGSFTGSTGNTANFELADKVVVRKGERRLYLLREERVIAEYPVRLGLNPYGHKRKEGDFRTPEGKYKLVRRNPQSEFFLSIQVSYPNREDAAVAKENGDPPGGAIMIHGQPNVPRKSPEFYATRDWTDGCIALSNADMVDVWLRTGLGIPIEIKP
jgi:hypothetical protein